MKKVILPLAAIASALMISCNIQSKEEYYNYSESAGSGGNAVSISIECSQILENMDKLDPGLEEYIPENGVILPETEYSIDKDESVYSVLKRAARDNNLQLEYQGTDENVLGTVYIEGINYIYEFSCGPESGWIYKINGDYAGKGCDSYKLDAGDKIEWIYACSLEGYSR